jgi:predicted O-methyltransferase YrrM
MSACFIIPKMDTIVDSTREKDLDSVCSVDGWLTRQEASLLYDLAHNADGDIAEIGSWQGRSTSALALGSMAGRKQTVYAIDPFIGPQMLARSTSLDNSPTGIECSPERLRKNLDAVGVNGLVRIVPKQSQDALGDVPLDLSLLFIDGAHDYESVCRDIDLYMPRVKMGGFVILHDVAYTDKGVVRAVDDKILTQPNKWRVLDRVDSAMVVRRVNTQRRNIALMCPGRGYDWGTVTGIVQSTLGAHKVDLDNNGNGWDDFNALWSRALNRAEAGEITHAAMLHADITPDAGFVDKLMDEIEELDLDMLSVACPLKDNRAILNCGIGKANNRWGAFRRLTVKELLKLPPTFGLDDLKQQGFCEGDDKVLLHNTGCFVVDLRKPVFWKTYQDDGISPGEHHWHTKGDMRAWFDFPTRVRKDEKSGMWINMRESEDWFFSRQLHDLGAKTRITRKVGLIHEGKATYPNNSDWGTHEHDNDTESLWNPDYEAKGAKQ